MLKKEIKDGIIQNILNNEYVKWYRNPDDVKRWEKNYSRYPYILWLRIMLIKDKKDWKKFIQNYLPNLNFNSVEINDEREFLEIENNRRVLYYYLARCLTEPSEPLCKEIYDNTFIKILERNIFFEDPRLKDFYDIYQKFHETIEKYSFKKFVNEMKGEHYLIFYDSFFPFIAPYESIYRSEKQIMGDYTMKVKDYYNNAGFNLHKIYIYEHEPCFDPYDEAKIEIEFMYKLIEKELEYLAKGDIRMALYYLNLQKEFISNHLIAWIPLFCKDLTNYEFKANLGRKYFEDKYDHYLKNVTEADFYRAIGHLLNILIEHDISQIYYNVDVIKNLDENKLQKYLKYKPLTTAGEFFSLIEKK